MGELSASEKKIGIKEIKQVDEHHLKITWQDDITVIYPLGHLQMHCPCTLCRDSSEEKKFKTVSARSITSVGNYALRVMFTEGCSQGIYPYSLLRQLQGERV